MNNNSVRVSVSADPVITHSAPFDLKTATLGDIATTLYLGTPPYRYFYGRSRATMPPLAYFLVSVYILYCTASCSTVRSARALPVQLLPFLVSLARPRSLVSRVSRAPRVSHPCSLLPLSHLGPTTATPSALAHVPTPPPASLISLFPLRLTSFPASLNDPPL